VECPRRSTLAASCAKCRKVLKVEFQRPPRLRTVCAECREGRTLVEVPSFNHLGNELGTKQLCVRIADTRQVIAMRHAESAWNKVLHKYHQVPIVTGLLGRWKDSPLSKVGLRQSQRLAMTLWIASGRDKALQKGVDAKVSAALEDLSNVPGGLEKAVPVWRLARQGTASSNASISSGSSGSSSEEVDEASKGAEVLLSSALADAQEQKDDALETLLGHACDSTEVVTSNLCRSMDTALIALLPLRAACPKMRWHISSNLQETEFNMDCEANLQPCHSEDSGIMHCPKPVTTAKQVSEFKRSMMGSTLMYVQHAYTNIDTSRNLKSLQLLDRGRFNFEHYKMMKEELKWMFAREGTRSFVWSVHSIWQRRFLAYFADRGDESCKKLRENKVENTAVIAFDVLKLSPGDGGVLSSASSSDETEEEHKEEVEEEEVGQEEVAEHPEESDGERMVVRNCRVIYLGLAKDFRMEGPTTWESRDWFVPSWEDFTPGIENYVNGKTTFKCCCSLPSAAEQKSKSQEELNRSYLGTCKVAEVAKCGKLNDGSWFNPATRRWHSYEKTFLGVCLRPTACIPEYGCEDEQAVDEQEKQKKEKEREEQE